MYQKAMLHIAICDDNKDDCKEITDVLENLRIGIEREYKINVFNSGEALLSHIENKYGFDVIFLDILMNKLDGVEVGLFIRNILKDENTKLIYISTSEEYFADLINMRVTNFIVKPLSERKIKETFYKALELISGESQLFEYQKSSQRHLVPLKDIMYFESIGKKVRIVMKDWIDEFYGNLSNIVDRNFQNFVYVQRSYYVNFRYIKSFTVKTVTMKNNEIISISRELKDETSRVLHELTNLYLKG